MTTAAPYDLAGKRVWVAGHRGMVGGAIARRLASEGCEVLTVSRDELDLTDQRAVLGWMHNHRPQAVFLAAARVGGILANDTRPVEFLRDNLLIETSIFTGPHGIIRYLLLSFAGVSPLPMPQGQHPSNPEKSPHGVTRFAWRLCPIF